MWGAIEKDDGSIVVSVLAVSSTRGVNLDAWELTSLTSDGADLLSLVTDPIEVHAFPRLRSKLWVVKIMSDGTLIGDGDTVFAVVDLDGNGATAEDEATCGRGLPRLHITAICK